MCPGHTAEPEGLNPGSHPFPNTTSFNKQVQSALKPSVPKGSILLQDQHCKDWQGRRNVPLEQGPRTQDSDYSHLIDQVLGTGISVNECPLVSSPHLCRRNSGWQWCLRTVLSGRWGPVS